MSWVHRGADDRAGSGGSAYARMGYSVDLPPCPSFPRSRPSRASSDRSSLGATITGVWTDWPRSIKHPDPGTFARQIVGREIVDVDRRAKWLVLSLSGGAVLAIQVKMTGQLFVLPAGTKHDRHVHVRFELADGRWLLFRDVRKFGRVGLYRRDEAGTILGADDAGELFGEHGPEPLADDFTLRVFRGRLRARKGRLKPLLVDQSFLAGVGNIYADEALWRAKLHPLRRADSPAPRRRAPLYLAIREVLTEGIERRGSSIDDYTAPEGDGEMQEHLDVYQRTGQPCHPMRAAHPPHSAWAAQAPTSARGASGCRRANARGTTAQARGSAVRSGRRARAGASCRAARERSGLVGRGSPDLRRRERVASERVSILRLDAVRREIGDFVILDSVSGSHRARRAGGPGRPQRCRQDDPAPDRQRPRGSRPRARSTRRAASGSGCSARSRTATRRSPARRPCCARSGPAPRRSSGWSASSRSWSRRARARCETREYARLRERFDHLGGYHLDQRVEETLSGLGVPREDWPRPAAGAVGWRADPGGAGAAARRRPGPAAARRAHQPPRPRRAGVAGGRTSPGARARSWSRPTTGRSWTPS